MLKTKRKSYGNTPWGKKWVTALESTNSDRLTKGRSLANRGYVNKIRVTKGKITASVESSGYGYGYYYGYSSSYRIRMNFEPFTKEEVKAIKQIIAENSSIAVELDMGNLPQTLIDELEKINIYLFPDDWDELDKTCDCYDDEDPCKHLAAVYFMLANEIDKDPFILFQVRGLKKENLVKAAGVTVQPHEIRRNTIINKFIEVSELKTKNININPDEFEFSFPQYDIKPLLSLLPDNPPFYNRGNFKTFLENIYNFASANIDDNFPVIHEEPELMEKDFQLEYCWNDSTNRLDYLFKIIPDKNNIDKSTEKILEELNENQQDENLIRMSGSSSRSIALKLMNISRWTALKVDFLLPDVKTEDKQIIKLDAIAPKLNFFALDYLLTSSSIIDYDKASDSFAFLNILSSMALGLVKANLFIPELIAEFGKNCFSIRYIPVINDEIQTQIDKLKQIMPQSICTHDEKFLSEDGLIDLLSIFITYTVKDIISSLIDEPKDRIVPIFAYNKVFEPVDFNEENIAQSISGWLEKLHISKKDISPVIRVEEGKEDNFNIFVDIINKSDPIAPIIPASKLYEVSKPKRRRKKKTEEDEPVTEIFSLPPEKVQAEISKQLIIAGQYMPELKTIIDSKGETVPTLTLEGMSEVMISTAGIFDVLGIQIILPKELKKLAHPHLHVSAKVKKYNEASDSGYLNLHEMLKFSYKVALGDKTVPLKDFRKLVKETKGLVKYKDQYLLLKPDEVKSILNKLKNPIPEMNSSMQALYTAVTGEVNGIKFDSDKTLNKILDDFTKIEDITVPETLNATLRPYQERGFKWLYSNAKKGLGSCIADDMGLGKTIQVITLLLEYKKESKTSKPSLVICPTTLIGNWEKECQKFAPDLNLNIYHGQERELITKDIDLLITSYGTLRRDAKKFREKEWNFLIIDEAQNIKNSETAQTKAVKSINASNYIAMTGTPVENRLTELWNIFDFINTGYMGSLTQFKNELASPIEKYKDKEIIEKFKKATSPFILRRLKTDKTIISDLPDKIAFDEYCYLTKEQAAVYQNIVDDIMEQVENSDGIERKGLIFKLITSLKQICNHPVHFSKKGEIESDPSGKAQKAVSILENIIDNKEKALIFTQYKEMGDILQEIIKKELKQDAVFFHGALTRKKRDEMINLFQTDKKTKIMIISLKAGGTGLNLTEASNVIHYDLWWNPAVENQATDRAYRIGQEKNVIVHRLITLGTFEEKIDEIIKSKKELADLTVSTGESWITEMSNKDLRDIFTLYKK